MLLIFCYIFLLIIDYGSMQQAKLSIHQFLGTRLQNLSQLPQSESVILHVIMNGWTRRSNNVINCTVSVWQVNGWVALLEVRSINLNRASDDELY